MSGGRVYRAIVAVTTAIGKAGIAKRGVNADEGYAFRSIDDVIEAIAPLLAKHKLCVLPRMRERVSTTQRGSRGEIISSVAVRGEFNFVAASDGSTHIVETFGEALDASDKATAKAMTAAYKAALVQTFCIPVRGIPEADLNSPRVAASDVDVTPVQGWDAWAQDIGSLVRGCETQEAIDRVQTTYRRELRALSATARGHFEAIGRTIAERREALKITSPACSPLSEEALEQEPVGRGMPRAKVRVDAA